MLKVAWSPAYVLPLPPNHRFPMSKYEVLPQQLLYEGTLKENNFFRPDAADEKRILAVHDSAYWNKLKNLSLTPAEIRRTGFPLTERLVKREVTIMQGTLMCTHYAKQYGVAMNIAGGTHHAFSFKGEGFCLLNDLAIAAQYALDEGLASKILIVDLDVHQGNGTAQIFRNEPRVFTFSMHGANNYPLIKETSDLDIGLPDGVEDAFYLKTLDTNLKNLIDQLQPDFMFFQSGVDILETDKLGRLRITREGCRERDRIVLKTANTNGIPVVVSMGEDIPKIFATLLKHMPTPTGWRKKFFLISVVQI